MDILKKQYSEYSQKEEKMNYIIEKSGVKAVVTDIQWERIFLSIYIQLEIEDTSLSADEFAYYAVDEFGKAGIKFQVIPLEKCRYILRVNVTNNGLNQCIPKGIYRIYVCRRDNVLAQCMTELSIVNKLPGMSRGFLYTGMANSYNVNFYIEDGSSELPFRICVANARAAQLTFPHNLSFAYRIKTAIVESFFRPRAVMRKLYRFYSLLGKRRRKNTVLFMTEQSEEIKSNLKAVSDRMKERHLDQQYHILYSARSVMLGDNKIRRLRSWLDLLKKMAGSGTIFLDDHAPVLDWLKLDKDTVVIQLWHAGAGFKSSGYSRWGHMFCPPPQSCHRQYRYGISGSKRIAPFFSEVWGINDEYVLPTGMPRMDEYLNEEYRKQKTEELYAKYPICKGKKVILFAPTYRGNNKGDAYYPYELLDLDKLYEICKDEYVVLFKMHPWVNVDIQIEEKYQDKFLSVLNYPNINDLFYITELLVTDYSSNIFEYSIMRKPMLFFAFDKVQYSVSRGFHRAYEESAPGKVCYTFDEVLEAIRCHDYKYEKVEQYVEHHFDYIDSHASDRVIDWLLLGQMPEDIKKDIKEKEKEMKEMQKLQFIATVKEGNGKL